MGSRTLIAMNNDYPAFSPDKTWQAPKGLPLTQQKTEMILGENYRKMLNRLAHSSQD